MQMFPRHVASVCFECFRCMFHLCFSDACCKCVYLDVAYVPHICCMCFIWMFAYGFNGFQVFSEACFKCFNCLQTYVAIVVFWCFKSRSGVASLLPTLCCIISPSADRASIWHRGRVLPNRRRYASFPSCRSGGAGPTWSAKRSVNLSVFWKIL
jgi:hypothetical protein